MSIGWRYRGLAGARTLVLSALITGLALLAFGVGGVTIVPAPVVVIGISVVPVFALSAWCWLCQRQTGHGSGINALVDESSVDSTNGQRHIERDLGYGRRQSLQSDASIICGQLRSVLKDCVEVAQESRRLKITWN